MQPARQSHGRRSSRAWRPQLSNSRREPPWHEHPTSHATLSSVESELLLLQDSLDRACKHTGTVLRHLGALRYVKHVGSTCPMTQVQGIDLSTPRFHIAHAQLSQPREVCVRCA